MAVHSQSVIPTWIQAFHPSFYDRLTSMENYAYLNPGLGTLELWKTEFQSLAAAMTSWKNVNRESLVADLLLSIFSSKTLKDIYGYNTATNYPATTFATMGGFIASTLSRPLEYYDDFVVTPSPGSVKLTADISTVSGAGAIELEALDDAAVATSGGTKPSMFELTMNTVAQVGTTSKPEVVSYIFNTLEWKWYFQHLNVGSLSIPESVI